MAWRAGVGQDEKQRATAMQGCAYRALRRTHRLLTNHDVSHSATSSSAPHTAAHPLSPTPGPSQRLDISIGALTEFAALKVAPHGLVGQTFDGDGVAVDGAVDDYSAAVVVTKVCACL